MYHLYNIFPRHSHVYLKKVNLSNIRKGFVKVIFQSPLRAIPTWPYRLGGTISSHRPIVLPINLWVWPISWVTGQLIAERPPSPTGICRLISSMFDISPPTDCPATAVAWHQLLGNRGTQLVWPLNNTLISFLLLFIKLYSFMI